MLIGVEMLAGFGDFQTWAFIIAVLIGVLGSIFKKKEEKGPLPQSKRAPQPTPRDHQPAPPPDRPAAPRPQPPQPFPAPQQPTARQQTPPPRPPAPRPAAPPEWARPLPPRQPERSQQHSPQRAPQTAAPPRARQTARPASGRSELGRAAPTLGTRSASERPDGGPFPRAHPVDPEDVRERLHESPPTTIHSHVGGAEAAAPTPAARAAQPVRAADARALLLSRRGLAAAMIASEILAPPVALRDNHLNGA